MSYFQEKYKELTVGDALELNKAAKWYCEHDVVSESEEI